MPIAKPAAPADDIPTLFKTAKAFEAWLRKNHAKSDGLWLKIAKRGAQEPSVTYREAVEIALCWGWIDGQKKGVDDHCCRHIEVRSAQRGAPTSDRNAVGILGHVAIIFVQVVTNGASR